MTDAGRGLSIERRLPLLMTAVLAAVLATSLVLTYRTLASTARATTAARLQQVARLLTSMSEQTQRQRAATLSRAARDSTLVGVLRRAAAGASLSAAAIDSARAVLTRLELPNDSGLPATLVTADGRPVAKLGLAVEPPPVPELTPASLPNARGDSVHTGPPFQAGGRVYYHVVVPVHDGPQRLGYIVLLRRLSNNPSVVRQLHDLIGEDAALYIHQRENPLWTTVAGLPTTSPTPLGDGLVMRAGEGRSLSATAELRGTPWLFTLEEPLTAVLARPRGVVGSIAALSVLLMIAGAAASWAIGRRMARPITQLTAAAESIARGDYRSRVAEGRADEIGRLARAFNAMTAEVDASQRELARQYSDARTVARELERSMRAVEAARDEAERANRAKSDFLAVMSHELRTPLNAISGYAELMQLGIYGPVTDEQTQALTRIARSQQHLLGLINDVLNFAKLNASKVQYDIRDVPVREAVSSVETMIAPQIAAKSMRYACSPGDSDVAVRADRDKLQQILLNLLSNAVKFTPSGGSVTVECVADGDTVHVSVRDTGVGIARDRLAHVFEPFVQVDRALNRPHEGVGLGLAISHDLALGMGGTLLAESTIGEGSVFTLVLPRAGTSMAASAEGGVLSAERR
ncbi:ATP-binding region ATPase domain protein [Gemmatirosa kalamazoonensis]|uniref:histidine kinase n=1 Tax=Gemmatirosa kalamazoonensis TaxID=861299 RepID=W0RLX0_9BACT|nr:HAMP domain-containing sensor histidine kinase [Gemmatirosa kalamazoonensis]AHG91310.1 ATP-binding region ATPase domain protein [Gemmatirosa kalamazoonensis]